MFNSSFPFCIAGTDYCWDLWTARLLRQGASSKQCLRFLKGAGQPGMAVRRRLLLERKIQLLPVLKAQQCHPNQWLNWGPSEKYEWHTRSFWVFSREASTSLFIHKFWTQQQFLRPVLVYGHVIEQIYTSFDISVVFSYIFVMQLWLHHLHWHHSLLQSSSSCVCEFPDISSQTFLNYWGQWVRNRQEQYLVDMVFENRSALFFNSSRHLT